MTSNKNKRSTPHISPHNSPHKFHKVGKAHKSPKERVAPANPSLPILPQKYAEAFPPILPPTRRILFPQSLKKSNSEHPFTSPHAVKIEHQRTRKQTLSSPAANFSDDRPFKKQCLSPSPAKHTKLLPATPESVNGREGTIPSSDDEYENENEDGTPSPPNRKRESNAMVDVAGKHRQKPPPRTSVAVVIPSKQQFPSSFPNTHPNSPAIQKIDMTVLRLEKENLQHRLAASVQQAQKAMNDNRRWENKCRETTDVQDSLNRLLRAEIEDRERIRKQLEFFKGQAHGLNLEAKNWEDRWKKADNEISSLRKRLDPKMETRKEGELIAEQWRLRYTSENEKTIKLERELKHIKNIPEPLHLTQRIQQLELELSNLKSKHHRTELDKLRDSEEHLESTNLHLAKQIAQLRENLQHQDQLITNLRQSARESTHRLSISQEEAAQKTQSTTQTIQTLTTQIQILKQEIQHKEQLSSSQITHLQEDLDFKSDLLSQAERTYSLENTALKQQIAQLKLDIDAQNGLSSALTELKKECEGMREEILDKNEEIQILGSEFEDEKMRMRMQVRRLEEEGRLKNTGLEKMGLLIAGWALKWRSLEGGERKTGAVPGVEGVGIRVDGVRIR